MLAASSDAAARLAPAQLREIREAFQVLDRDNDGSVNKDDVADVLVNIGKQLPSLLFKDVGLNPVIIQARMLR